MTGAGKFAPRVSPAAAEPVSVAGSFRSSGSRTVKMSINFDAELRAVLKMQAVREGRTIREITEDAVSVYLRERGAL